MKFKPALNFEPTLKALKWMWRETVTGTSRVLRWIWKRGLIGTFLAGLFVILPILLTVAIIQWLVQALKDFLGPGTLLGNMLTYSGAAVVGRDHDNVAFWLGVVIAIGAIWLIGVLIKSFAKRKIDHALGKLLSQVPIFRTIYKPVSQILKLLRTDEKTEMQGMTAVFCSFGADHGVRTLALQPGPEVYTVDGVEHVIVYIPTSPVPMSGGLIFVRKEAVSPAPEISVDDVMKVYLSLGALGPQSLPAKYLTGAAEPDSIPEGSSAAT